MADPAPEVPAEFRASIIVAPLAILGAGALVTHLAAEAAARNSHGGWINLSSLSYAIAWVAYGLCAAAFVWMDSAYVRRLPGRTWPSQARMLAATAGAAAFGIAAGVIGGGLVVGAVVFVGTQRVPGAEGLFFIVMAAIPLALLVGLVVDLRVRRSARIRVG